MRVLAASEWVAWGHWGRGSKVPAIHGVVAIPCVPMDRFR